MWSLVHPLLLMCFRNFIPSPSKLFASSGHCLAEPCLRHMDEHESMKSSLHVALCVDLKLQRFWYLAVDWTERETWSGLFVGHVASLVIGAFSKASLSGKIDELSILLCLLLLASFLGLLVAALAAGRMSSVMEAPARSRIWRIGLHISSRIIFPCLVYVRISWWRRIWSGFFSSSGTTFR